MTTESNALSLHPLLSQRRSPRAFDPRPLDAETVAPLFEAARWAPSSYNEQPWSFLVALRQQDDAWQEALECLVPSNRQWARHGSLLIFTLAKATFRHNDKPNAHAFHDVGLAIAQLTVQATACGLMVHQMGGIDREAVRRTYAVPEGWDPVTGVVVGHAADPASLSEQLRAQEEAPRQRKNLAEIVFQRAFGEPADFTG